MSRPWYKRYPSDFIAGTAMMTDSEKGVYSTLIDMMYDRGGPIEDCPSDLARICGCASVKRFQGIKERLVKLGKIAVAGGHITNARFEREGTAGSAKTRSGVGDAPTTGPPEKPPDLLETNGLGDSLYQRPEARSQKRERGARARAQLPEDFSLNQEFSRYAQQQGFPQAHVESMFAAFCDHHRARGNAMVNWLAAWRTWCRNEVKFGRAPPLNGGPRRGHHGNSFATMAAKAVIFGEREEDGISKPTNAATGRDEHGRESDAGIELRALPHSERR